jgi:zinc protease
LCSASVGSTVELSGGDMGISSATGMMVTEPDLGTADSVIQALNDGVLDSARIHKDSTFQYGSVVVEKFSLGNGLQVILWPDHSAPVFAYQTWFGVGSRHERPGRTGMAHFLEHLMFKETKNQPEGAFDQIMENLGAQTNAATWVDWTYYRAKLPTGNLETVAKLEADRMENVILYDSQVDSEREVVKNERLGRIDNDPDGKLYEELYALAFDKHPYQWPTIGWMADIEAITLDDCLDFYRLYYAPNNAVITIVGDVVVQEALALIQSYYGHMNRQELPVVPHVIEPLQTEEKRKVLSLPVATPRLVCAWHGPALNSPDHAPFTILNEILTVGESSLLYSILATEKEMVSECWGWVPSWRDPGIYEIGMNLRDGTTVEDAEAELDRCLTRVLEGEITEREVEKVKNGLEIMFLRSISDTGNRARGLGNAQVTGTDYRRFFEESAQLNRVTVEQVVAVARKYIKSSNRTVVIVRPTES